MKATFSHEARPDGVVLTLRRRHWLSRHDVPVEAWTDIAGREGAVARFFLGCMERGEGAVTGTGVLLPHRVIAALPATVAEAAGLPPLGTLSATLAFDGIMTDPRGRIRISWYDAADRRIRIERLGAIARWGRIEGRLSALVLALADAIDAYNATEGSAAETRIAAWAPVQAALAQVGHGEVRTEDRFLTSLTVYQAGAVALDVMETADGPNFLPVVMGREKVATREDNAEAPDGFEDSAAPPPLRDIVSDALLPQPLQQSFAHSRFVGEAASRDAYVLGQNTYLVLAPDLKGALDVIRRKRAAPRAERVAFLKNPRAEIAAAMGDARADASSLLVETWQYSERVLGLGIWEPPPMPWLKTKGGQWLPEHFPVDIGTQRIELDKPLFETLKEEVARAEAAGRDEILVDGRPLQVRDVQAAFERIGLDRMGNMPGGLGDDASEPAGLPPQDPPQDPSQAGGEAPDARDDRLVIRQNLEGRDFEVAYDARKIGIAPDFPGPPLVTTPPKPHQTLGFDWLVSCYRRGWPGALLADDMGLGKTFQALAFLAWMRNNRIALGVGRGAANRPVLIVAPTALLRNWAQEAELHLGPQALGRRVDAYGTALRHLRTPRDALWSPETALDVAKLRAADWVLTTYESLADYHRAFARVRFSVAVFDEAQKIKSPGTINTQSAKAMHADFVLGLTGTPIENRLADLWCIMDRVVPGYLGDLKAFVQTYETGGEAELTDLKAMLDRPRDAQTPPLLLRRMKSEILDGLPPREIRRTRVPMPAEQAEAYQQAVVRAQSGGTTQGDMMRALHAFRGISLHPHGAGDCDPLDRRSVDAWISRSARLIHGVEMLEAVRSRGEKALVFIESFDVQALFAAAMATRFGLPRQPAIINGSVAGEKRLEIVDRFQSSPSDFDLLVLGPQAAGVGLNITAANHVLHLSRWWNPAVEDQCNDRCYRIGQNRPVTVYIPVAVHPDYGDASFDVRLDTLLEGKRKLSRDMLAPPVGDGDLHVLFRQTVADGPLPAG